MLTATQNHVKASRWNRPAIAFRDVAWCAVLGLIKSSQVIVTRDIARQSRQAQNYPSSYAALWFSPALKSPDSILETSSLLAFSGEAAFRRMESKFIVSRTV